MQDAQARRVSKGRRREIEVLADADDVRVGVVRVERRVGVAAIAVVGLPGQCGPGQAGGADEGGEAAGERPAEGGHFERVLDHLVSLS